MEESMHIELRNLQLSDYLGMREAMQKAYPGWEGGYWSEASLGKLLQVFPEGQFCITVNGVVAGIALAIIVQYDRFGDRHSYQSITGDYSFSTHTAEGDTLYGIEVFVHPAFRGKRLARRLYDARKELCEYLNLKAIVAGGRIPGYAAHADKLTPQAYILKVKQKELFDPTLTFQLSNDFHVKRVLKGYLPGDKDSREYATLLEWINIHYQVEEYPLHASKPVVRLGLVQWQMRPLSGISALADQLEFFIDALSGYKTDFILFPELFNAPLMAQFNHLSEAQAMRELAGFTEELRRIFTDFAVSYNANIITGSMPLVEDGLLYNVGYLCRRDGTWESYKKIHITPSEQQAWGMVGGNVIQAFDTDCGRVGILICYDVEFPELGRLLADQGVKILFVPFLTDTQNGYTRVRHCAMARAIENECYVAMAGSVGNLPRVENMDIQFAQSAVFTPSDFAFPTNAIKAEATPNTEMTLIVDVDVTLLDELHSLGSVRNLKDRRPDVYALKPVSKNTDH